MFSRFFGKAPLIGKYFRPKVPTPALRRPPGGRADALPMARNPQIISGRSEYPPYRGPRSQYQEPLMIARPGYAFGTPAPKIARPPVQRMPQGGAPFPDGERQVSWALPPGQRPRPPVARKPLTQEQINRHLYG